MDQAQLTAFSIVNTRAARRESFLSHLPFRFSSVSKAHLSRSDADADLLFDSLHVNSAIEQAEKAASVSLTEAAAKSLVKAKPKPGPPWVEKLPHPSTSYDSHSWVSPTRHCPSMKHSKFRHSKDTAVPPAKKAKNQPFRDFPAGMGFLGGCLVRHLTNWETLWSKDWVLQMFHEG